MNFSFFFVLLPLLLLLIVVAALFSHKLEQMWHKKQTTQTDPSVHWRLPASLNQTVQQLRERWQEQLPKLQNRLASPSPQLPQNQPENFLRWADEQLGDEPELRQWLHSVPEGGLQLLTQRLADFCTDTGFELAWALNGSLQIDKTLHATIRRVIVNYCRSCYYAVAAFPDLRSIQPYLDFQAAPTDKAHRPFGMQLYAELAAAKLTQPAPPNALLVEEPERWDYVVQAIAGAAAAHPRQVHAIVQKMVRAAAQPPATENEQPPKATTTAHQNGAAQPAATPAPVPAVH
ncbi:MAG: hypothetical protein ACOYL7_05015 [Caldilinea sp.]